MGLALSVTGTENFLLSYQNCGPIAEGLVSRQFVATD